jgi:serine/threonine protein kinase
VVARWSIDRGTFQRLKHENLVTMIEVFRHRKRFFLVFEFLEGTVLDELEKMPGGLGDERCRERIYQVTRAINYCHSNHVSGTLSLGGRFATVALVVMVTAQERKMTHIGN